MSAVSNGPQRYLVHQPPLDSSEKSALQSENKAQFLQLPMDKLVGVDVYPSRPQWVWSSAAIEQLTHMISKHEPSMVVAQKFLRATKLDIPMVTVVGKVLALRDSVLPPLNKNEAWCYFSESYGDQKKEMEEFMEELILLKDSAADKKSHKVVSSKDTDQLPSATAPCSEMNKEKNLEERDSDGWLSEDIKRLTELVNAYEDDSFIVMSFFVETKSSLTIDEITEKIESLRECTQNKRRKVDG